MQLTKDINIHRRNIKKGLKKSSLINEFTMSKYALSPYMACSHGCKYCDGRAERYYVEGDFEKDIVVRVNLPLLLEKELKGIREKGKVSIGSGVTDCYQPVEQDEKITRKCARVLLNSDLAVSVMTKSALALRDIDIWKEIAAKNGFTIVVSLTFLDDNLRKIFEPGASPVEDRLNMLRIFKENGCSTGVLAMPLIPGITDQSEHIANLVTTLKDLNVDFIMPGGLTIRPGIQKNTFLEIIKKEFPGKLSEIESIYSENRTSGNSRYVYREHFNKKINQIFKKHSMHMEFPHKLYKDKYPLYDEVQLLMYHMINLYSRRGVNIKPISNAYSKYKEWLLAEKKVFNRRRKMDYREIEDKLKLHIGSGEMEELLGNHKLSNFLKEIAIKRKTFDYEKLALVEIQI